LQDIQILYEQHTQETGQVFTPDAISYAFEQTQGQPWLVNALAYQACFRDEEDRAKPITKKVLEDAKEALIKRCDTHFSVLIDSLQEPRVCAVIDAIISGENTNLNLSRDDLSYLRDLGLIKESGLVIKNPIYQEIIPRALSHAFTEKILKADWKDLLIKKQAPIFFF
jgi:hypothetical protein